ncbi:hypothetical protein M2322_002889 [Rhodoblastus acidophilus]|uniref:hypothetical protein n=1 Tax=Rhodoblastus acidophilus TaxID=1074 RepID=UPI0022259BE6|nr:hypothetical protein [Rhodoblastus acidophilus]MCW2317330.1 hypothetical protein [Rhodoblastus acidophilus]
MKKTDYFRTCTRLVAQPEAGQKSGGFLSGLAINPVIFFFISIHYEAAFLARRPVSRETKQEHLRRQ